MRIALFTSGFSHDANDWCIPVLVEFVRQLSQEVEVDVYTLTYPFETRDYRAHGARVFAFGWVNQGSVGSRISAARAVARFKKEHEARPYDIIHARGTEPGIAARKASTRTKVPFVFSLFAGETVNVPSIGYGGGANARTQKALRANVDAADAVTAGSNYMAGITAKCIGIRPRVMPIGANSDRFQKDGHNAQLDGEIRLLTVASINKVKGHGMALDALEKIADLAPELATKIHYHIIGEEQDEGRLRARLVNGYSGPAATYHGAVPYFELPDFYREADLFLLPSFHENDCAAVMESAFCGTPIMGSAVGILPDMVSAGWRSQPGDSSALADMLIAVLANPETWADEGQKQREWALANTSLTDTVEGFIALYREIVHNAVSGKSPESIVEGT